MRARRHLAQHRHRLLDLGRPDDQRRHEARHRRVGRVEQDAALAHGGDDRVGLDANEFLIVVHTIPGAAHTVGEYIDQQLDPDLIGTVGGDNTLLVIPAAAARPAAVPASRRRLPGRG